MPQGIQAHPWLTADGAAPVAAEPPLPALPLQSLDQIRAVVEAAREVPGAGEQPEFELVDVDSIDNVILWCYLAVCGGGTGLSHPMPGFKCCNGPWYSVYCNGTWRCTTNQVLPHGDCRYGALDALASWLSSAFCRASLRCTPVTDVAATMLTLIAAPAGLEPQAAAAALHNAPTPAPAPAPAHAPAPVPAHAAAAAAAVYAANFYAQQQQPQLPQQHQAQVQAQAQAQLAAAAAAHGYSMQAGYPAAAAAQPQQIFVYQVRRLRWLRVCF